MDLKLNEIKRKLEMMRCESCNKHPEVKVEDNKISFSACCDNFSKKVQVKLKTLVSENVKTGVNKEFSSMFKNLKKR